MKKFLIIFLIALILAIFQTSLLAPWFSNFFQPDIPLVFLAALTVVFGFQVSWIWIVVVGAVLDLLSYSKVGTHVAIFSLTSYLVSFISRRFAVGGKGAGMILVIFLMPLITGLDLLWMFLLSGVPAGNGIFALKTLEIWGAVTLENIALFFLFYYPIRKFKRYYSPTPILVGR